MGSCVGVSDGDFVEIFMSGEMGDLEGIIVG